MTKSLLGPAAASLPRPLLARLASGAGAGPLVLVRPDAPLPGPAGGDLSAWLERRGRGLEFAGPTPARGAFVPFYEIGAGAAYQMDFDLA